MFYRKITFARLRMLVLTCLILLGVFGQIGAERTAQCFNCEFADCPSGPVGSCTQGTFPSDFCTCTSYDGTRAICIVVGNREK